MPNDNPWLERRVLSFAHQGGAREAPSTTLFAMRRAVAAGVRALELDVHSTADGHLVCCHDESVDRTTDGHGAIASMVLRELRALDNAYWYAPGYVTAPNLSPESYVYRGRAADDPEFRIPTLVEVLDAFPGVFLNLDIKQTAPAVRPYEEDLARLLREYGRSNDVIVASFHDMATERFASSDSGIGTSAGTAAVAEAIRALRSGERLPDCPHVAFQVPSVFGDTVIVDSGFVEALHAQGIAVHVWTIDDQPEMERLAELGVDGIMTDCPSTLVGVLEDRGVHWRPESN